MEADSETQRSTPANLSERAVTFRLTMIGFAAGVINGLLSIGGGILFVPGLIFLRGAEPQVAVATSLGTVMLMSAVAMVAHLAISGFHLSLAGSGLLILSGMAAAQLGGWLLNWVRTRWIYFGFSAVALMSASNLLAVAFGLTAPLSEIEPPLWSYSLMGALSGLISGMVGVGGGAIAILGLSVFFHTPVLGALPLSLAINITNSLSGVLLQSRKGNVLWRDVFRIFPATLPGVGVGIVVAVWLSADALRIAFALFFVFIGGRMIVQGLRSN